MIEPAFPTDRNAFATGGMTLRDYFAAKALTVVPAMSAYNMKPKEEYENYLARRAYAIADHMMKARGK